MPGELWVLKDEAIRVSFKTDGYSLHKGGTGSLGLPVEAFLRLVAVKGNEMIAIQKPSDLAGKVVIENPSQALEFVRLFTSIATEYLFPEIDHLEAVLTPNGEAAGEYTEEYRRRVDLKVAAAWQEDEFFLIERPLLSRSGTLFEALERVGRDGTYVVLRTKVKDAHSPIRYPLYQ